MEYHRNKLWIGINTDSGYEVPVVFAEGNAIDRAIKKLGAFVRAQKALGRIDKLVGHCLCSPALQENQPQVHGGKNPLAQNLVRNDFANSPLQLLTAR